MYYGYTVPVLKYDTRDKVIQCDQKNYDNSRYAFMDFTIRCSSKVSVSLWSHVISLKQLTAKWCSIIIDWCKWIIAPWPLTSRALILLPYISKSNRVFLLCPDSFMLLTFDEVWPHSNPKVQESSAHGENRSRKAEIPVFSS